MPCSASAAAMRSLRQTARGPCRGLARRRPFGDLQGHTANAPLTQAKRPCEKTERAEHPPGKKNIDHRIQTLCSSSHELPTACRSAAREENARTNAGGGSGSSCRNCKTTTAMDGNAPTAQLKHGVARWPRPEAPPPRAQGPLRLPSRVLPRDQTATKTTMLSRGHVLLFGAPRRRKKYKVPERILEATTRCPRSLSP